MNEATTFAVIILTFLAGVAFSFVGISLYVLYGSDDSASMSCRAALYSFIN